MTCLKKPEKHRTCQVTKASNAGACRLRRVGAYSQNRKLLATQSDYRPSLRSPRTCANLFWNPDCLSLSPQPLTFQWQQPMKVASMLHSQPCLGNIISWPVNTEQHALPSLPDSTKPPSKAMHTDYEIERLVTMNLKGSWLIMSLMAHMSQLHSRRQNAARSASLWPGFTEMLNALEKCTRLSDKA